MAALPLLAAGRTCGFPSGPIWDGTGRRLCRLRRPLPLPAHCSQAASGRRDRAEGCDSLAAWRRWRSCTRMASRKRTARHVPRLALNQTEAAQALGMSVDAFEQHVKPCVACVYAGSRRLYPVASLERWLTEESVQAGRRAA